MNPKEDGVTHINVYSKAATKLGCFLSNFYPVDLEISGEHYRSIEAYWYSLWAESVVDEKTASGGAYRNLQSKVKGSYGYQAKMLGKNLMKLAFGGEIPEGSLPDTNFQKKIISAIRQKLWKYPEYLELFKESRLPFAHYYFFGTVDNATVVDANRHPWLINGLENLRFELKDLR